MKEYALLCSILLMMNISPISKAADSSPLTPEIQKNLSSPVITLIAEVTLKPEGVMEARAKGIAYSTECRQEKGCIQFQIHEDSEDPGVFFFYEQYASPEAFNAHVNSEHLKRWLALLEPYFTKPLAVHFLNKIDHMQN
jgi:quinol monooxygenase YgiN